MKIFSRLVLFSALATVSLGVPAWSQTEPEIEESSEDLVDLQTMTCREILKSEGEDRANTLIFMHGYINGTKGETTVNPPILADVTNQILDTCIDNPDRELLSVFEDNRQ